jgi:hypothetical protein
MDERGEFLANSVVLFVAQRLELLLLFDGEHGHNQHGIIALRTAHHSFLQTVALWHVVPFKSGNKKCREI